MLSNLVDLDLNVKIAISAEGPDLPAQVGHLFGTTHIAKFLGKKAGMKGILLCTAAGIFSMGKYASS
jgi:hypothetical protein